MPNINLSFLLAVPVALVGAWYIYTGGSVYLTKVKPLTPVEGDTIQFSDDSKPVSLKFKNVGTLQKEGLLSPNAVKPKGLDPDFDANAALERLKFLKEHGNFSNRAELNEVAELMTSLRRYEENGGTYR